MKHPDSYYFQQAIALAQTALARGDDGFASVLVGPDGEIVLAKGNEAGATSHNPLNHDTFVLINEAVQKFDQEFLTQCTIYAVMEPCVMCMGAAFWAGIPNIKFAMSEAEMNAILPGGLEIHSGEFVEKCPRFMQSIGPYPDMTGAYDVVKAWIRKLGVPVDD